jgi:hypothetical protein
MRHPVRPLSFVLTLALAGPAACKTTEDLASDTGAVLTLPEASIVADAAAMPSSDASTALADATSPVDSAAFSGDASQSPHAEAGSADDGYMGLAAPKQGFRLRTQGREIPINSDVEYCEVQELPGTPGQEILMGAVEVANAIGSHHLIVSVAEPGSLADKKLRTLKLGEQVPCIGAEIEFGTGLTGFAGAQTPHAMAEYPPGIAQRLRAGQRVVFDYHYFNFGTKPLVAKSAVAVHTRAADEVKTLAAGFAFTNMTVDTPPSTSKTFTAACRFKHDALVQSVGRHTHTRGTDFTVWFEGGARHGQQIWQSLDWEHDAAHVFEQPTLVKAGEGFKFACSFTNPTNKPLRFGIASTDEMCILSGSIWSPTPGMELDNESCVITWVDAQGMGHDAKDNGGPPQPSFEDALTCHAGMLGIGFVEGCVGCICDSCGTVMNRCNADPDCKALLDCRSTCSGDACNEACEATMFKHSSAVGMITQVGLCIEAKCGTRCVPAAPADAGVP